MDAKVGRDGRRSALTANFSAGVSSLMGCARQSIVEARNGNRGAGTDAGGMVSIEVRRGGEVSVFEVDLRACGPERAA